MSRIKNLKYWQRHTWKISNCSRATEEAGVDAFVTGDQSLVDEQNLAGRRLAIVALSANNWPIIRNYIPRILAGIESAAPGSFQAVDCGTFSRKKFTGE